MATSRVSLRALCLLVLALPSCIAQNSQGHELADLNWQELRASNGRRLLQVSVTTRSVPIYIGDADGGLTLGSVFVANNSQVLSSSKTTWSVYFNSTSLSGYSTAANIAQTDCGVMQAASKNSSSTSYAIFGNLTVVDPPNVWETKYNNNTRVSSRDATKYAVGPVVGVGKPASFVNIPYPYTILPLAINQDFVLQTINVLATFRPVGKVCSSATFGNDGQQASPVQLWAFGKDVLNRSTGGRLSTLLFANATCISIKLDVTNAPTKDQLNATVNLNLTAYAKLGVPGPVTNQSLTSQQQLFRASNVTSSYSAYQNSLDPGTIYAVDSSGSGPTQNAVTVSVRMAMLTQNGADCSTQLRPDLRFILTPLLAVVPPSAGCLLSERALHEISGELSAAVGGKPACFILK